MDKQTQTELEAAAFRTLVEHLRKRTAQVADRVGAGIAQPVQRRLDVVIHCQHVVAHPLHTTHPDEERNRVD